MAFLGITVMTWPWIIVGLGSLIEFPISGASAALAADPELAYPMMLAKLMPVGLKGMLVAAFLAAFMSTMDTHLCWGGSYLVNDLYRRFWVKNASEQHYVGASRVSILILTVFAALTAWQMDSIEKAWIYLIDLTAGMALVMALRWYWWRVNAWAEISAMIASLILANGSLILDFFLWTGMFSAETTTSMGILYTDEYNLIRATFILVVGTVVWVTVALLTRPDEEEVLNTFYRRVRPGGWWGHIAKANPDVRPDDTAGQRWLGWFLALVFVYAGLLGIGYISTERPYWAGCWWL